ncbi:phage portal protein [Corticicoccus populi]|uniref:Phage portal protein n=1 Tax=Corticicoccus populi TaxID=1812821 RepID=A0ABW5WV67_9STAP
MENADIYTAISTIANDVSSLPIKVTDTSFNNNEELEYLLNTEPNAVMSGKNLIYVLIVNAILNGNSFAQIERDKNGIPINIHHLSNDRVTIQKNNSTDYTTELIYEVRQNGKDSKTKEIKAQNIIHIMPFSTDGIKGVSPLVSLRSDIEAQQNSKKFFNSFFKNGTQSGGTIKVASDLDSEAKELIRQEFQRINAGTENSHKVLVLDEAMSYEPIKVDTEILKLINESKYSTQQVAKVLGLPLHKMGIETHSQSLEQASNDYLINTLSNYISVLESEFNRKLFNDKTLRMNNKITFSADKYKYVDAKTKREIIKNDYELGLISQNEAREEIGKPALENGDRFIQSLNYMNSELIDNYQVQKVKDVQKNVVDEPLEEKGDTDE